jgi:hypothetical protein
MREILAARWNGMGDKLVRLADAVPESDWERAPAPGVRSFAEQLRHVAFWNAYARDVLRGGTPDGDANELPRSAYPTKAAVVDVLRSSFDDVAAEIAKRSGAKDANGADGDLETIVSFLEHAGEHYGQLAVYARLAGVVPPASRPQA